MAKTETLSMRIDPQVKSQAENVLQMLGVSTTDAVNMFLKQVIFTKSLPFEVKMPDAAREEAEAVLLAELAKGKQSAKENGWLTIKASRAKLGVE